MAANWTKTEAEGERIALVFNEQKSDAIEMAEDFDAYKVSRPWGAALNTLTFEPSRGQPLLQAVDLMANETFNYWLDTIRTTNRYIPLHPALNILWRRFDFSLPRLYGMRGLSNAIQKFVP